MFGENILTMYLSFTIQISKYPDPTGMKIFFLIILNLSTMFYIFIKMCKMVC